MTLVVFTALGAVGVAPPAAAQLGRGRAQVDTDPSGAHVELDHAGAWVDQGTVPAPRRPRRKGTPDTCQRMWVPAANDSGWLEPGLSRLGPQPGPDYVAYNVYCGGLFIASVWLLPTQFNSPPTPAQLRAVAERLARDLPYPAASIGANPARRGLSGLDTWFWVDGYTGAPLRDSVVAFGMTVLVEATPRGVRWSFGDGTAVTTGTLGRTGPQRSDVVHRFERRSRREPFRLAATVDLAVRYRVDGGDWLDLDPVERGATRPYPVAQSRAALVRRA
jgi:hypothetical protein